MMKRLKAILADVNSTHQEDGVDSISIQTSNETPSQKPIQDIILPQRRLPVVPPPKHKGFYGPEQRGALDNSLESESFSTSSNLQKSSSSSTLPTPMRHQVDDLDASSNTQTLTRLIRPTTPAPQKQQDKYLISESGSSSQPRLPYLNLDRFSMLGTIGAELVEQNQSKRKRPGSAAPSKRKVEPSLLPSGPIQPPKLSRVEEVKLFSFQLDSPLENEKPMSNTSLP